MPREWLANLDNELWNERYGAADRLWSGNPHPQLADIATDLPPGRALDIACGEGADAVWLAEQGWDVTAVDFSHVAIERASQAAAERNLDIAFIVADLDVWVPDKSFDLTVEFYLHFESDRRRSLHRRLQPFVAAGGKYLTVGHHPDHAQSGLQGPPGYLLFGPDDLEGDFSELTTLRADRVENPANERHAVDTIYLGQRLS